MGKHLDPDYCKKWNLDNKDHLKAYEKIRSASPKRVSYIKALYEKNKEKITKRGREIYSKKIGNRFSRLKTTSKLRGFECTLTLEEYSNLVSKECFYCKGKLPEIGSGLDRADSLMGYTLNNCLPCCTLCNKVKGQFLTVKETQVMINALIEHRNSLRKAA